MFSVFPGKEEERKREWGDGMRGEGKRQTTDRQRHRDTERDRDRETGREMDPGM